MNNKNSITIALVDDTPLIHYALQVVLRDWGYHLVLEAMNGGDLLRQLTKRNAPDICITDIHMPGMNGYETIRALKEKWPGIRVIAFSADDGEAESGKALRAGADLFVAKSASLLALKTALHTISNRIKPTEHKIQ